MTQNDNYFPEKRDTARILDAFPINYTVISQKDFKEKESFYKSRRTAYRPVDMERKTYVHPIDQYSLQNEEDYSPSILKMFSYLDQKLNMILYKQEEILKQLAPQHKNKDKFKKGECIDISGTGVKILTNEKLKKDSILELHIEPIIYPPIYIVPLAKIVKLSPSSGDKGKAGFEVSTEFIAINENDRDELIKYTFTRQRELIAFKKDRE
jgi:hypothetical protein